MTNVTLDGNHVWAEPDGKVRISRTGGWSLVRAGLASSEEVTLGELLREKKVLAVIFGDAPAADAVHVQAGAGSPSDLDAATIWDKAIARVNANTELMASGKPLVSGLGREEGGGS